ncbi:hypothetical protein L596_009452 [Steinernema carpocapsae]|uniref:Uncharacterized protein n=1 Tax=Steinernema carpocapsae TaxID=34508 RepID=A0A4U5PG66_STECR|nr:hypothetical protein L596_009452 [Steinernema carpocapsae]
MGVEENESEFGTRTGRVLKKLERGAFERTRISPLKTAHVLSTSALHTRNMTDGACARCPAGGDQKETFIIGAGNDEPRLLDVRRRPREEDQRGIFVLR